MSVDGCAVLFLGKKEEEVMEFRNLPNFDDEEFKEEGDEYLVVWTTENGYCRPDDDRYLVCRSADETGLMLNLVGFEIAMAGEGDMCIIKDVIGEIARKSVEFETIFGVEPEAFVLCYQW